MSRMNPVIPCALVALALLGACASVHQARTGARLDEASALKLAVDLANAECGKLYFVRPFAADNYTAAFSGDRWHWGEIDPAGPRDFSAAVSFDAFGNDRQVKVAYHVDKPLYR